MEKHNILGKKAEASAAFKEKIIALTAWIFIIFCSCVVIYFSKIGLKTLFLSSNKHFTLEKVDIQALGLPEHADGLVDLEFLEKSLQLNVGTDNLFDLKLKDIQKKVVDHICIEKADVSYNFPNKIIIKLVERNPIARLSSKTLIDKHGNVLPDGRRDLILPQIFTRSSHKPGYKVTNESEDINERAENEKLLTALNFIKFNETFRMSNIKAAQYLGHKEFASMEILKVKSVSQHDEGALTVMLSGVPEVMLADNTRLKIPIDDIELGIRRACISILHNRDANKTTRKIDARYNSTATE